MQNILCETRLTSQINDKHIFDAKVMSYIWWDQKGMLYYELINLGQRINVEVYRQQLVKLKSHPRSLQPDTRQ